MRIQATLDSRMTHWLMVDTACSHKSYQKVNQDKLSTHVTEAQAKNWDLAEKIVKCSFLALRCHTSSRQLAWLKCHHCDTDGTSQACFGDCFFSWAKPLTSITQGYATSSLDFSRIVALRLLLMGSGFLNNLNNGKSAACSLYKRAFQRRSALELVICFLDTEVLLWPFGSCTWDLHAQIVLL